MTAASVKNPPFAAAGLLGDGDVSISCNLNIAPADYTVKVPAWMSEKLARIAAKIDLWAFEQTETIILAKECHAYPAIASMLPAEFRERINELKPRELSALERAAIIISSWDWRAVVDIFKDLPTETKVGAKIDALMFALREGGNS